MLHFSIAFEPTLTSTDLFWTKWPMTADEFNSAVRSIQRPPDPRHGPFHPKGTVVTGVTRTGLALSHQHKDHLWVLMLDSEPAEYANSGRVQPARCVVCEELIPPTDCEFWQIKATVEDVAICSALVRAERTRLHRAAVRLNQIEQRIKDVRYPNRDTG